MHFIYPTHPNITAFHSIILLSWGAPLIPAGGSCCSLLKSLISLFLAGVDIVRYRLYIKVITNSASAFKINAQKTTTFIHQFCILVDWANDKTNMFYEKQNYRYKYFKLPHRCLRWVGYTHKQSSRPWNPAQTLEISLELSNFIDVYSFSMQDNPENHLSSIIWHCDKP